MRGRSSSTRRGYGDRAQDSESSDCAYLRVFSPAYDPEVAQSGKTGSQLLSDKILVVSFSHHSGLQLRPRPTTEGPVILILSPPSSPNASTYKDRRRTRCLLRWQVQNLPRVPCSSNSSHLLRHIGHRAVHQLVERLPEDWRVVVIERNTYVSLTPPLACWKLNWTF